MVVFFSLPDLLVFSCSGWSVWSLSVARTLVLCLAGFSHSHDSLILIKTLHLALPFLTTTSTTTASLDHNSQRHALRDAVLLLSHYPHPILLIIYSSPPKQKDLSSHSPPVSATGHNLDPVSYWSVLCFAIKKIFAFSHSLYPSPVRCGNAIPIDPRPARLINQVSPRITQARMAS